ncbi:MAG TPA: phosphopentomutase [Devosia sp.]|nr:phosphopentomutase [Devosia sp.]
MPRVILCVLDSVGIGGAPDAADFGDEGSNTVGHIAEQCALGNCDVEGLRQGPLNLPNLNKLGLGAALELSTGTVPPGMTNKAEGGVWGVGREVSIGKDTPSGHWEIAGLPVPFEWGYFPDTEPTFPDDLIKAIVAEAGLPGILGNKHASGTVIIEQLGAEHVRTGKPICYTSVDSVFQIAAHETHFGLQKLYDLCEIVFKHTEPLKIGRVIARPFVGDEKTGFTRTGNRRDFAIDPPAEILLDRVKAAGRQMYAIGKISDIYAGRGVTHKIKASGNMVLFDRTLEAMEMSEEGAMIMTNFVDFDSEFGHRRDVAGYAGALEALDARIPELISRMRPDDLLLFTADHGNDPTAPGTDHTREQVPVLMFSPALKPHCVGIRLTFADIGQSVSKWLDIPQGVHGTSFL